MTKILITGSNGFVGKRLIVDLLNQGHLILYAGMKVPGEAWLQFKFEQKNHEWFLVQTATFRRKGLLGRLYWYALVRCQS